MAAHEAEKKQFRQPSDRSESINLYREIHLAHFKR